MSERRISVTADGTGVVQTDRPSRRKEVGREDGRKEEGREGERAGEQAGEQRGEEGEDELYDPSWSGGQSDHCTAL